jgi:hypothetical protein
MAEWLRRQIRTRLIICFPLGAQVQILLVSSFLNTYFYIVVAVVVASECGTVGCTVGAGGGSSEAREPVEDWISAELEAMAYRWRDI